MIEKGSLIALTLQAQAMIYKSSIDYWKDKAELLKLEIETEKAIRKNVEEILDRERKAFCRIVLVIGVFLVISMFTNLWLSK